MKQYIVKKSRLSVREQRVKEALDRLVEQLDPHTRIAADPIRFPKRYQDPHDQEVVALFSAVLSYGRVKSIGDTIERLLPALGVNPAISARQDFESWQVDQTLPRRFDNFIYRFTREPDLQRLWRGIGSVLLKHGSIQACFHAYDDLEASSMLSAYQGFYDEVILSTSDTSSSRGFHHLFSNPRKGSALKRINMWLRWMVRGPDDVDLGGWKDLGAHRLLIPLDVHIYRLSHAIGLTKRKSTDLKTVIEITSALRRFAPHDPIKYDFALAHLGISGSCLGFKSPMVCQTCPLDQLCSLPTRKLNNTEN